MIDWIGLDGDDTLWHSERHFVDAHERYRDLLDDHVEEALLADLDDRMLVTERRNLELFGYGVKGFTLSMIETAIELTDGRIPAADIHRIIEFGKEVLRHPVELLPDVRATVPVLAEDFRIVIITKGDLFHQESKIANSGLAEEVHAVEIVAEKDPATYRRVLDRHAIDASRFVMVGNSVRSDVLPVLEIGGRAVEIPYQYTWAHERVAEAPTNHPRLARFGELPGALARLS